MVPRTHRVRVGDRSLVLTAHAVERWRDRLRPALSLEATLTEVKRVLAGAEVTADRPSWTSPWALDGNRADEWVVVSDQIAMPVTGNMIVTLLDDSWLRAETREHRKALRLARADRRRKQQHGRVKARENAKTKEKRSTYE